MKKKEWLESIILGIGGFVLFIAAGVAAILDLLSFQNGRPLFTFISRRSGHNDMGIVFTLILGLFALIGLISFVYYLVFVYKRLNNKEKSVPWK